MPKPVVPCVTSDVSGIFYKITSRAKDSVKVVHYKCHRCCHLYYSR